MINNSNPHVFFLFIFKSPQQIIQHTCPPLLLQVRNKSEGIISESYLDYKHDPRYRRYASAIEKNLQTFEAINEWPDFISFLSRLTKVVSS